MVNPVNLVTNAVGDCLVLLVLMVRDHGTSDHGGTNQGQGGGLLTPRDAVGRSCRLVAWIVWFESIGMGSSIIDLLYDESISLR